VDMGSQHRAAGGDEGRGTEGAIGGRGEEAGVRPEPCSLPTRHAQKVGRTVLSHIAKDNSKNTAKGSCYQPVPACDVQIFSQFQERTDRTRADSVSRRREKKKLQELEPVKQLDYTKIPRVIVSKGASLTDITRLHMDKSAILDHLITQDFKQDPQEILGEMQFAFIAFFIGQSLESFEQWKALVILFSSCTTAIETHPQLFEQYAKVLFVHLEEAPDDFFVDELSKNNFVQEALKALVETAAEYTISRELEISIRKLKKLCKKKFKWDFDQQLYDTNDEYAPVIVDEATVNQT